MEYKIVKVDTERTRGLPYVLIRGKDRKAEGLNNGDIVNVVSKKESETQVSMTAICSLQFKEFIKRGNMASISEKLAEGLKVGVDDIIEINNHVTESQAEALRKQIAEVERQHFEEFHNLLRERMLAATNQRQDEPSGEIEQ